MIATQLPRILKDFNLAENSAGVKESIASYDNSPMAKFQKLNADYETALINLGLAALPVLIPMVNRLADYFKRFNEYAQKNPDVVKRVAKGLLGLSAALVGFGTLSIVANGFRAIGLALSFVSVGGVSGLLSIGAALLPFAPAIIAIGAAMWGIKWLIDWANKPDTLAQKKMKAFEKKADDHYNKFNNDGFHFPSLGGTVKPAAKNDIETVKPGPTSMMQLINNTIVMPDGKVLAKVVTEHQAKSANKPFNGQSAFDMSMSPLPAGMRFAK